MVVKFHHICKSCSQSGEKEYRVCNEGLAILGDILELYLPHRITKKTQGAQKAEKVNKKRMDKYETNSR